MKSRSELRDVIIKVIYQANLFDEAKVEYNVDDLIKEQFDVQNEFVDTCVKGILENKKEIYKLADSKLNKWTMDRLNKVDQAIIALGIFELKYIDTPSVVAINEAIELSKTYSEPAVTKMINGVLDKIYHDVEKCEVRNMNDKYITVSQLTRYIKYKIDNDVNLNEVFLKGEISNFKAHTRGHYYFTLKDDGSRINAIMFASSTKKLKFMPSDGMKVLVTGKISVFEANGGYQIYVNDMLEDGIGNLYIAYEQLKKKLEAEGLFDQTIKKKIPRIPKRIGVVTAPTGAAIKDIISTIKRRWPIAEVYLFPALVQGEDAKEDIVKQIHNSINYDIDTLIVGRGGGSIEDLWAFNEEIVARAIYECPVPVISAVGHEIDFTIADFVADLRAPTPTGAAEMAVPDINDIKAYLEQIKIRLNKAITNDIKRYREKLIYLKSRPVLVNPITIYQNKEMVFDKIIERLKYSMKDIVSLKEKRLITIKNSYALKSPYQLIDKKANKYLQIVSKLETLSPLLTIKRGYSITRIDGKVLSSVKKIKKKDVITVEFSDGDIKAEVL